ncbi:MAG: repeat protein [Amycolatopsis sp.]|nr:repeat protein [Amycolatopsis sp.]
MDGSAAQKWTLGAGGSLKNAAAGRCLDIPSANAVAGADLQIYTCNNTGAQHWTLTDRTDYVYDANGNRLLERTKSGSTLFLGETEATTDTTGTITRSAPANTTRPPAASSPPTPSSTSPTRSKSTATPTATTTPSLRAILQVSRFMIRTGMRRGASRS